MNFFPLLLHLHKTVFFNKTLAIYIPHIPSGSAVWTIPFGSAIVDLPITKVAMVIVAATIVVVAAEIAQIVTAIVAVAALVAIGFGSQFL